MKYMKALSIKKMVFISDVFRQNLRRIYDALVDCANKEAAACKWQLLFDLAAFRTAQRDAQAPVRALVTSAEKSSQARPNGQPGRGWHGGRGGGAGRELRDTLNA